MEIVFQACCSKIFQLLSFTGNSSFSGICCSSNLTNLCQFSVKVSIYFLLLPLNTTNQIICEALKIFFTVVETGKSKIKRITSRKESCLLHHNITKEQTKSAWKRQRTHTGKAAHFNDKVIAMTVALIFLLQQMAHTLINS